MHGLPKSRTQYALCILDDIFQRVLEERREHFFQQLGKRIAPRGVLVLATTRDVSSSGMSVAYQSMLDEVGCWQVTHHEGYGTWRYDQNKQLFNPPSGETLLAHAEESFAGRLIFGGTEYTPAQYPDSGAFAEFMEERFRSFFEHLFIRIGYEGRRARTRREEHLQKMMTKFTKEHPEKPFTFTRITDYLLYQKG